MFTRLKFDSEKLSLIKKMYRIYIAKYNANDVYNDYIILHL